MGKDGDLWDDSALVDAFDHALSNYKMMHGTADNAQTLLMPPRGGSNGNNSNEDLQEDIDGNAKALQNQKTCSSFSVDETDAKGLDLQQGQSCNSEHSGISLTQDKVCEYSDAASMEYSQLLGHYYELQNQQQKVLEQLYQTSYWNNQPPNLHCTTTTQEVCNSTYAPKVSCASCFSGSQPFPNHQPSHSAHTCHPGTCNQWSIWSPCLLMSQTYQEPKGNKGKEPEKEEAAGRQQSLELQNNIMDTTDSDLSAVIGAWYSAGFYTGRYLLQQSLKKDKQ